MANPFEKKFIAQKRFTDRDDFKKILRLAVETDQRFDEYRIKVFYGVGGQGKSYLKNIFFVKEFLKPAAEENKKLFYCDAIDFEKDEPKRQPDEALLSIAKVLIEKADMALPAFSLGFLKYKNLSSSATNLVEDYPYLFRLSGKKIAGSGLANEVFGEVIGFGAESLASGIPIVGHFIKKMLEKGKDKVVEWVRKSDANPILGDLDELDKFSLLERLPELLAYDVFKSLEEEYFKNDKQETRIIIILDGYETLWQGEKNSNPYKDKWVRTLARKMPGVLFVIFSRDKLQWAEQDRNEEFRSAIDQHLIKGLSDEDADSYLKSVPIPDIEIRNAIIKNAKGGKSEDGCLPLYLDIEVNTYEQIMNNGEEPSKNDFEQSDERTAHEIVSRFFRHIRPELSNAIEALSLANYFDNDIIRLMENSAFAPGIVDMKTLGEFSFIYLDQDRATIHSLVREVAAEQFRKKHPDKYIGIHSKLFDYFNEQLVSFEQQEINPAIESLLANAAHHKEIYDPSNFCRWISDKAYSFFGIGYYNTIESLLKHAIDILEKKAQSNPAINEEEIFLLAELYYHIAYNDESAGRELSAGKNITDSVTIYRRVFTKEYFAVFPETGATEKVDPVRKVNIGHYQAALELAAQNKSASGKISESGELYSEAQSIASKFNFIFDEYGFTRFMMNAGRLAEAEPFFFDHYNTDIASNNLASAGTSANDLGKLFSVQGRFEEAVHYLESSVELFTRALRKDHEYIGIAMHSLAAVLIREGNDLQRAENLLNRVWDIYMKKYKDDHLYFGNLYKDMFLLYVKKDINKAIEYYNKARAIISHNAGDMNAEYITMLIDIAEQLKKDPGNIKDEFTPVIIDLFLNDFNSLRDLLGIYNANLHRGLAITADYLESKGDIELADTFRKRKNEYLRVLKIRTHIRTTGLTATLVEYPEKEYLMSVFKNVTSLPNDGSDLIIERFDLPFYRTYDLFKITFLNTERIFSKYVLFDNITPVAIDWSAKTIYGINSTDLDLSTESAAAYTTFFCDCISGEGGKFYMFLDEKDIPWRLDVNIEDGFKNIISKKIKPLSVSGTSDLDFTLDGFMLYQENIYGCAIQIGKQDGFAAMLDDDPLRVYKSSDSFECYLDSEDDKSRSQSNSGFIFFDSLPCCIDPVY